LAFAELYALGGNRRPRCSPFVDRAVAVNLPDRYVERKRGPVAANEEAEERVARSIAPNLRRTLNPSAQASISVGSVSSRRFIMGCFPTLIGRRRRATGLAFIIGEANVPRCDRGGLRQCSRVTICPRSRPWQTLRQIAKSTNWVARQFLRPLDETFRCREKPLSRSPMTYSRQPSQSN